MSKAQVAIIGTGEVPFGKYPERTDWDMIIDSTKQAVEDAGISKDDIEAVVPVLPLAQPRFASEVVFGLISDELGLNGNKANAVVSAGGASGTNAIRMATHLIEHGIAKIVLVTTATWHSAIPLQEKIKFFATAGVNLEWEYPYGMTFNGLMAMMTERYMYETGATPEEMASVCVSWRKWAQLDPNAMFRKPLTIEQVLESRMVTTPLHSFECNVLADGGSAIILAAPDVAKEITDNAAYKLSDVEIWNKGSVSERPDILTRKQMNEACARAFAQAGRTVEDMSFLELYTAYPVWFLAMLEETGACERGKGARFVYDGHTSPGGKMPANTIGEATSRGHNGSGVGLAYYVELARQLMGKCGEKQIPNCTNALSTSGGGSGMNWIGSVWSREDQ